MMDSILLVPESVKDRDYSQQWNACQLFIYDAYLNSASQHTAPGKKLTVPCHYSTMRRKD